MSYLKMNIDEFAVPYDKDKVLTIPSNDIEITYHVDGLNEIKANPSDKHGWIDLYLAEDIYVWKFRHTLLNLGISIRLPEGYEAIVAPTYQAFEDYQIIGPGSIYIINDDYYKEDEIWKFPVITLQNRQFHKNENICRFRIIEKQPEAQIKRVER